ncbi:hypothetical protein [Staphylococcus gallinarum]|uniref:hypothetical protein n=1 Tax=Staphylococcus gallinarum TaxID=1293 RepID=UPI001E5F6F12|nr:hypothetical protein [Staphylococcus gallinarum]MCD8845157.1 hypothetical protein [Staphylococcus gallinarum]
MVMKLNKKDLSVEDIKVANRLEKDKFKAFLLPLLVMVLMLLELLLKFILNIDISSIMLITFLFSIIINSYVLYKVKQTKKLMSIILTAHHNNITTKQLFDLPREKLKKLNIVNVNWRTYSVEYFMIILSAYICTSIYLFSA